MHSLNHNQTIAAHIILTISLLRSRKTYDIATLSQCTLKSHTIVAIITLTMWFLRSSENTAKHADYIICYDKRSKSL